MTFGSLDDVCTSLFEKLKFAAGKILSKSIQDDYSDFIEACSIGYFVAAHQPQETINFMRVILDIALQGAHFCSFLHVFMTVLSYLEFHFFASF